MAAECTQEALLGFLREKGGKVRNADLIEHFKAVFPEEPQKKAAVRQSFKNYVDNIAYVRAESEVKYVCLRRKFRLSEEEQHRPTESDGTEQDPDPERPRQPAAPQQGAADDAEPRAAGPQVRTQTPGSGYGNKSQVRVPHAFKPASILAEPADDRRQCPEFVCRVEDADSPAEMGNRESFRRDRRESRRESRREQAPDIPEITVIEASPLPAEGSVFTLPGPVQTGSTGQVHTAAAGLGPTDTPGLKEAEQTNMIRRRNSKGSQHRSRQPQADGEGDEGDVDTHSLSGSEGSGTPKGSRKHFIEVMMNSSPQVRRSLVPRSSVYLSSRNDNDSASLVSSNLDDDSASVTLDPLEHEWMMSASDGEWGSLRRLLATEPSLVLRKDFVTGFTCLHWAAKHGKPELIALIINYAKQHNIPVSVDVRSNSGYTPLHIAAMHNHMEVVKILVGAYNADVEIRDYSGRKACQYLTDNVSVDIRDIIGAYERSDSENAEHSDGGHWRFSKVLQSNLRPRRLLSPNEGDSVDGEPQPREKPVRRKSSLSRMKPKLQKLHWRTSQIVHSTSFWDTEEKEESVRRSFKSRPKTHFFG